MHCIDADKMHLDNVSLELHNTVMSYIEQIMEATPQKQQLYGHLHPIT